VAAYSVGFMPIKWIDGDGEKEPRRTYTEQELLEISHVVVPSNRDAIQSIRSKSTDPIICKLCDDAEKEIKAEYNCECIECGHKMKSEKHCADIKCPECGGEMRRAERPGKDLDGEPEHNLKPYPNEHACRLKEPGLFQDNSFRRVTRDHEGKKYSVIMGKLKGESEMTEQAYRYDKDTWDASEARSHCKAHKGSFEAAKPEKTSQEQIIDEIDYLTNLIKEEGLNAEAKTVAETLVMEIRRISGSDIPVEDIAVNDTTVVVDNTANDERLKLIIEQTVKNVIKEIK